MSPYLRRGLGRPGDSQGDGGQAERIEPLTEQEHGDGDDGKSEEHGKISLVAN